MGMARSFAGGTTAVTATITALNSGDWTIAAWANPTTVGGGNQGVIAQISQAGSVRQSFRFNSASLDLLCNQVLGTTNTVTTTSTLLTLSKWWCLVATFRASDVKCRVFIGDEHTPMAEAAYASQTAGSGARSTGGSKAVLGNGSVGSTCWNGAQCNQIADAREWSLPEMEYFRACGRPPSFASLRYWFPLDSNVGTTAERDKAGLVADAAVTSNQGFAAGPALWLPRLPRTAALRV